MKIPLSNKVKMLTIEEGSVPGEANQENRLQRMMNHFNVFKWFITINVLILLIFCSYALWSLYQLESAMRSREGAINLDRYFNRYDVNWNKRNASPGIVNDSVIISDFHEWRQSIISNLDELQNDENEKANASYNLKFLLHSITSIVKTFVDNEKENSNQDMRIVKAANSSSTAKNNLIITNLTDFEIHILKEFTKLKMLENKKIGKLRNTRTIKDVKDESGCNLHFSVDPSDDKPIRVIIEQDVGNMNVTGIINNVTKKDTYKGLRECSFKISYKSNDSS